MRIPAPRLLAAFSLLFTAQLASAQPPVQGPIAPLPPARAQPDCPEPDPDSEEIVVCGERYDENSPYRIPKQFRDGDMVTERDSAWSTRMLDQEMAGRFSGQNIGAAPSQQSQQLKCQWLAERQIAQGRQPDCTARNRADQPTDWQRR